MSRYILIRRLRWPAILLLAGVVALLHELGAIDHFWQFFVPLLLILLGTQLLAERTALATEDGLAAPYAGVADPAAAGVATYPAQTGSAIVPANSHDLEKSSDGGQS